MKKDMKIKKLLVCAIAGFTILHQPLSAFGMKDLETSSYQVSDIDEGIYNLRYKKREVLATKGERVERVIPKEGILKKDSFVVVEREKKSIDSTPVDISIIDSMIDRAYPGAIQLADEDFLNNYPNLLTAKRKPMNISIDLPGMRGDGKIQVDNPTYSNVNSAINELVHNWSDKYSLDYSIPARIQYSETMVHSKSQLASALNVNANLLEDALGIDFKAIRDGEKKVMVAQYKQIFYTVSSEVPNNPSDLFDDSVSFRDLERKGVSDETPPVMVSNVTYGRTIYVKLETNSKSRDVQSAFKAVLTDKNKIESDSKYKDILDESSFTAVVLGGDAKEHNRVVTKDFDEITSIIRDYAEFSPKNPAYPISYTSIFLKDNSVAKVHNNTEYVETKATEYKSGKINITHTGAYVAQFEIYWDEVSYDEDGKEILEQKAWEGNWQDKTARFSSVIYLPANATNIRIYAREATGLAWEWWRTVVDEYNVPLSKEINLSIWGTTLHPYGEIEFN